MKILLDTNIVLDLLLAREPFLEDAREIFLLVESDKVKGYLCATTITTIYYLLQKNLGRDEADRYVEKLLVLFDITPITKNLLLEAMKNNDKDYEDSVIYTSAKNSLVEFIITKDKTGFKNSKVPILSPDEFLALYKTIF